jgi:hypothetical protein
MIMGFALGGAVAGFGEFGPIGGIIGFGLGLALGGTFAEGARFCRR